MKQSANRLVLIDGNAILHRAYHALPPLTSKRGAPTNAVYGFTSTLFNVMATLKPTHLAVAFDRPGPTFRNEMFVDYQAQRPEMDDELKPQVSLVHDVVSAMGIPIFELDGYEADDVIATLAKQACSNTQIQNPPAEQDLALHDKSQKSTKFKKLNSKQKQVDEVIIVTGDRDLLQLVDDRVKLYMPVKGISEGKLFGRKETIEKLGVPPEKVVDLKALMGDPSDNYPGVNGVGSKTAQSLIQEFGSVERLYKSLGKLNTKKLREKLEKDKDNALLSLKLAKVVSDAPIEFDPDKALRPKDLLTQEVVEVFGNLGFKTLLKRLTRLSQEGKSKVTKEASKPKPNSNNEEQMGLF